MTKHSLETTIRIALITKWMKDAEALKIAIMKSGTVEDLETLNRVWAQKETELAELQNRY